MPRKYTRVPGSGRRTTGKGKYTRKPGSGTATTGGGKYTRQPSSGGRHGGGVAATTPGGLAAPNRPATTKTTARKAQRLAGLTAEQKAARAKRYQKRRGLA